MHFRRIGVLLLFCVVAISCGTGTRETDEIQKILAVMKSSEAGWNNGDIDSYMQAYWQSDSLRFASGGSVSFGWSTVFERYKANYSDRAAMGRLSFSEYDIDLISPEAALVFGRWRLERETDQPEGLFTLLLKKTSAGWRIVHDHTSIAQN